MKSSYFVIYLQLRSVEFVLRTQTVIQAIGRTILNILDLRAISKVTFPQPAAQNL